MTRGTNNMNRPKWLYPVASVVVYAGLAGVFGFHLLTHGFPKRLETQPCPQSGQTIEVSFDATGFHPAPVFANRCDTIIITNRDRGSRRPALGVHTRHIVYPSFREQFLRPSAFFSFTVSIPGTFLLHDHINEELETTLVVSPSP